MSAGVLIAIALLESLGWQVFPPPSAPRPGDVWVARNGGGKRQVVSADHGNVVYLADAEPQVCRLRSWHRWRQRTRAARAAHAG